MITKQDFKASIDALVQHIVTYSWNQSFLTQKCVNVAILLQKCENTAFLLRKFVNTAFLSPKFVITAFLSRKFVNTAFLSQINDDANEMLCIHLDHVYPLPKRFIAFSDWCQPESNVVVPQS